jgi:hypothetical protein
MTPYERFRVAFAGVLDPRFYTIEWLDYQVDTGAVHVVANDDAACLLKVIAYPTGAKEMHCMIAAGELHGILALIPDAEAWGREQGCIVAVVESREGWARAMSEYGYAPYQVAVRKVL